MTEHFSFFDAIQDSNGHYDREYNAQQFTDYFKSLVTTGVMKGAYNQLEVTANGSNMTSSVKSGVAFVEGRYYYNDALLQLTHDTDVIGLSRIDRIVVRMDLSTEARYVKTFIKKGVPAASPVPPTLTQTTQIYEISLSQILVVGGQTFIEANAVTDERGKEVICPWASSNILPSFDDNALATHMNDITKHVPYVQAISSNGRDYNITLEGVTEYFEGMSFSIKPSMTSTENGARISINGLPLTYITYGATGLIYAGYFHKDGVYTVRYNGSFFALVGDGFGIQDSITSTSKNYAASANAVKQVNDKFEDKLRSGISAPEGVVTAPIGTIYTRTSGNTATTTLYIKTSGVGNTGWTAK